MFKNILIALLAATLLGAGAFIYKGNQKYQLPDMKGRSLSIGAWTDLPLMTYEENGELKGFLIDYFTEACKLLSCKPVFYKTDATNISNMIVTGKIDASLVDAVNYTRLKMDGGRVILLRTGYGIRVRSADKKISTIEEFAKHKEMIIATHEDWTLPDMLAFFAGNKQLHKWPLGSEDELLLRGVSDGFVIGGAVNAGKITYAPMPAGSSVLDGNVTDQLNFVPGFTIFDGTVANFDIATAIMFQNGTMDRLYKKYFTGVTVPYRYRVLDK